MIALVLAVLAVAGVLLAALHHQPRQETTMPETAPTVANSESVNASTYISSARRFVLVRDVDVSGVSGTGVVAEGVVFSDDTTVLRWVAGDHHSTVVWPHIDDVEAIHGHGGATRIVWVDVACRACGCTDDEACFPSCYWVEPYLCSGCVGKTDK